MNKFASSRTSVRHKRHHLWPLALLILPLYCKVIFIVAGLYCVTARPKRVWMIDGNEAPGGHQVLLCLSLVSRLPLHLLVPPDRDLILLLCLSLFNKLLLPPLLLSVKLDDCMAAAAPGFCYCCCSSSSSGYNADHPASEPSARRTGNAEQEAIQLKGLSALTIRSTPLQWP